MMIRPFDDLYERMVIEAPRGAHLIELGCRCAGSALIMGRLIEKHERHDVVFTTIDDWSKLENISEERAHTKCEGLPVNVMTSDSAKAADRWEDGSVFFCFVDAGHEFDEVVRDIEAWWPKIAPGGMLAGDDLVIDDVHRAVVHKFGSEHLGGWQRSNRQGMCPVKKIPWRHYWMKRKDD